MYIYIHIYETCVRKRSARHYMSPTLRPLIFRPLKRKKKTTVALQFPLFRCTGCVCVFFFCVCVFVFVSLFSVRFFFFDCLFVPPVLSWPFSFPFLFFFFCVCVSRPSACVWRIERWCLLCMRYGKNWEWGGAITKAMKMVKEVKKKKKRLPPPPFFFPPNTV